MTVRSEPYLRALDGGMGGQDDGQLWVGFFQPTVHQIRQALLDMRKDFRAVDVTGIRCGHQAGARNPRDGDHLDRQAKLIG